MTCTKSIYNFQVNNTFIENIEQFNMMIGQRQMENIQKTIDFFPKTRGSPRISDRFLNIF